MRVMPDFMSRSVWSSLPVSRRSRSPSTCCFWRTWPDVREALLAWGPHPAQDHGEGAGDGAEGGGWDPDENRQDSEMAEYRLPTPRRPPRVPQASGAGMGALSPVCRAPLAATRPSGMRLLRLPAGDPVQLYPKFSQSTGRSRSAAATSGPRLPLPAGHVGQDAPRHLLAQQAQRAWPALTWCH